MTNQIPTAPSRAISLIRRDRERGFTLIELILVVTIIGLLAGIAVVNVRGAQRKAAEAVLKGNLANMRTAIDNFYADKQRFPTTLQELVEAGYLRRIPADPITRSADTWIEVFDQPDYQSGTSSWDMSGDSTGMGGGVIDVRSGAEGETMDTPPVPYGDL